MHSRRIVIGFILSVLLLFGGIQIAWHAFSLDQKLRQLVLDQIRTAFKGEATIGSVVLLPGSLNFRDVRFTPASGDASLEVKNLRLGFSLLNALKYNFNPVRIVSNVALIQPVVRIREVGQAAPKKRKVLSPERELKKIEEEYRYRLVDLGFVGQITLEKGQILWSAPGREEIVLVRDLDGWISTENLERAEIRLKGRLFRSESSNLLISGFANLARGKVDSILVSISDDRISTTIPTLFPEVLAVRGGKLYGQSVLFDSAGAGLVLNGRFFLENGQFSLFGDRIVLDSLYTNIRLKNWNVLFDRFNVLLAGQPVEITGEIGNLLAPQLNLKVRGDSLWVEQILSQAFGEKKVPLSGWASIRLAITGPPEDPVVRGTLVAREFEWKGEHFQNVLASLHYRRQEISVGPLKAKYRGFELDNRVLIRFAGEKLEITGQYAADGSVMPWLRSFASKELNGARAISRGTFRWEKGEIAARGNLLFHATFASGDSLRLEGDMAYQNNRLTLRARSPGDSSAFVLLLSPPRPSWHVELAVDHFGGKLWRLFGFPGNRRLERLLNLNLAIVGDEHFATFSVAALRKRYTGQSPVLFTVDGTTTQKNGRRRILGDISYYPETGGKVDGSLEFRISPERVELVEYRLGDFYYARFSVDRTRDDQIEGLFRIQNADLMYIFDGALLEPNFEFLGRISGELDFSGTLENPVLRAGIALEDAIIRGEGYFSGKMRLLATREEIHLDSLAVAKDGRPILWGQGRVFPAADSLDLEFRGEGVDLYTLLTTILPPLNFWKGNASFDLRLTSRLSNPDIRGTVDVQNGQLFFVNFDSLHVEVGRFQSREMLARLGLSGNDGGEVALDELPSGFYVKKAELFRQGKYTIHGEGYFPLSTARDLYFVLQGTGDGFAVLFDDLEFVKRSRSDASFRWGFGGTYNDVVYTEGSIFLKNGQLELEDVARKVDHIEIEARLEPMQQFLHFEKVTGYVQKRRFEAMNFLDSLGIPKGAPPLVIESWGLNFGYIRIKTEKKGVPLHIPGLMEKGEIGFFRLKGQGRDENFLITGPAEQPYARGEIYVENASITFPFVETEKSSAEADTGLVEKILMSMLWDVKVIPGKDVRYVKQLPGLIDKVWINAQIDPEVSELYLTGVIQDETFRILGNVRSTRGTIEYLDLNFSVEEFGAEFDRSSIYPIVYGRARTTITDTLGFPSNIYLTLYVYDRESKQELERGRWSEDLRFRLSSDNPLIGTTEGQILAALGYSVQTIRTRAADLIGIGTEHLLFRPLFRPFERKLERLLGLDMVRIRSRFARNVMDINALLEAQIDPRYLIFRSTQIMIGKYLTDNLYLAYSGMLEAGLDPKYQEKGIGFKHSFDLEYRISPNLLLELQYNYDSLLLLQKEDKRIQLRHSFVF
jgi:hypothetical protein